MRRVLPLLVLLLVCVGSLAAQQMEDVVYLRDGTVVRGEIIENIPNQSIRIRTRDGSVYVYTYNLIERMTREPVQVPAAAQPAATPQAEEQQLRNARTGFWIGLGLGYGGLSPEDGESLGSFSGMFKLGGTLSQNLLLGVQTNGWTKKHEGVDLTTTFGTLTAVVQLYPMSNGGLYIVGGAGVGTISWSEINESGAGFAWTVGTGYDLRLGRMFSITPYFNIVMSSLSFDFIEESVSFSLIQGGLAVNWH